MIMILNFIIACNNGNASKLQNQFDEIHMQTIGIEQLKRFYNKLSQLEVGKINKVRVLQFGDSHTSSDWFTGELRRRLSKRFGSGGAGFIYAGKPWSWYYRTTVETKVKSQMIRENILIRMIKLIFVWRFIFKKENHVQKKPKDWIHYRALFSNNHKSKQFRYRCSRGYGLGGVCTVGLKKNGEFTIKTKTSQFNHLELWYLKRPKGGDLELSVNKDNNLIFLSTSSTTPQLKRFIYDFPKSQNQIKLRIVNDKSVTLFGLVLENRKNGVVFDTLGLDGAKINHLLRQNWTKSLISHIRWRSPDLIILAYGTNSVNNTHFDATLYEKQFLALVKKIKHATRNKVDILVLGPPDFNFSKQSKVDNSLSEHDNNNEESWYTPSELKEIIQAQINVSRKEGAAFINQYALMGGEESMDKYVKSYPPLAQKDHIHLTKLSYHNMAKQVYQILIEGYISMYLSK